MNAVPDPRTGTPPFVVWQRPFVGRRLQTRRDRSITGSMKPGFTLIELLVTLAMAAILATLAVPAFRDLIMNNRITTEANRLIGAIQVARSTAVRNQRQATICASNNPLAATPACSGSSNWANGWIVWVDRNRDGNIAASEVVRAYAPSPGTVTVTGTAAGRIDYDPMGMGNSGDLIAICDNRTGETGRRIRITASGRASVENLKCN